MSGSLETTQRFFRPSDVGRIRRNQRRIQVQRFLVAVRNTLFAVAAAASGMWAYRQTQFDTRFAVRHIEITGAVYTPRQRIEDVTGHYAGLNLFRIDIARVRHDLASVSWISRIEIEKKLPDTLRINVMERTPMALLRNGDRFEYVDEHGVAFGALSPAVGDSELPLISGAGGAELARTIVLIRDLRLRDPQLFSRLSEIRPIPPRGFAIFDRDLASFVYANSDDIVEKWRALYAIARKEQLGRAAIEYADLRFAGRVVIKPAHQIPTSIPHVRTSVPAQITN